MRRIVFTIIILIGFFTCSTVKSQTPLVGSTDPDSPPPQALMYQAQALDNKGNPIKEKSIHVHVLIHALKEDSNPPEWEKQYYPVTDKYGMFTLILGDPEGNDLEFNKIPWYKGPVFLEVILAYKNEEVRSVMQFLSVPYAMHAGTAQYANNAFSGDYYDLSNLPNLNDYIDDADADPTNELQDWSTLPGIPEGFADNTDDVIDDDSDPTNELQDWSTLPGIPDDFADGVDQVDDADADPENEVQGLELSNDYVNYTLALVGEDPAWRSEVQIPYIWESVDPNTAATNRHVVSNGNITADGAIIALGNIASQAGGITATTQISAGEDIRSGRNMEANGDVIANENMRAGGILEAGQIHSFGDLTVDRNIEANGDMRLTGLFAANNGIAAEGDIVSHTGNIEAAGQIVAGSDIHSNGNLTADANLEVQGDINAGGLIVAEQGLVTLGDISSTAGGIAATTHISAGLDIRSGRNIEANGDIIAIGNMRAGGILEAVQFHSSGDLTVDRNIDAAGQIVAGSDIHSNGNLTADANLEVQGDIIAGGLIVAEQGLVTLGDISSTAGGIAATTYISAGLDIRSGRNIEAGGDVISNGNMSAAGNLTVGGIILGNMDWSNLINVPEGFADDIDNVDDEDADPTNELQNWGNLPGIPPDIADGDDVVDADADPANELQTISFETTTNTVTLTDGGSFVLENVVLPAGTAPNDFMVYNGTHWVAASLNNTGGSEYVDIRQPYTAISYIIALQGIYPSRNGPEPFIGEISMFGGNFAPRGWAFCDGQLLAISQNAALFSLLGTTYGGDGRTTFALPDLRGRAAIHHGQGPGLSDIRLGQRGGNERITLTEAQMPSHNHEITYH